METPSIDTVFTHKLESSKKMTTKTYHAPLLTKWGDLQDLTAGSGLLSSDGDGTGSRAHGRPQPIKGPIPPWLRP
jgi:hypothetical protein